MKSVPSSVLILIMFVSVYIFCVSTYTFITALNNVNFWTDKRIEQENSENLLRIKRDDSGGNGSTDVLLNDLWKNNITFNICCNQNEYLNTKHQCIKSHPRAVSNESEKSELLSQIAVIDKNLTQTSINTSRIYLRYNFKEFCQADEITDLTWMPNKPYSYYISQKDGRILELSDNRKKVVSEYSTSSYCLNRMGDKGRYYGALLCPCLEKVCIRKCCKKGYYYNTIESSCKESVDNIPPYKPTFYNNNVVIKENIPYHLIHNGPTCSGPDKLIQNRNGSYPLHIQKNGQLVLILEERKVEVFIENKQYCVDVFSDGHNSSSVNGFYCQKDIGPQVVTQAGEIKRNRMTEKAHDAGIDAIVSSDVCYDANFKLGILVLIVLFFMV